MNIMSAYAIVARPGNPSPPSYRNASPYGQEDTITYLLDSMASIVQIVVVLPNGEERRLLPIDFG